VHPAVIEAYLSGEVIDPAREQSTHQTGWLAAEEIAVLRLLEDRTPD
jgi:hypothetical protein